jgi:hypothetical protein
MTSTFLVNKVSRFSMALINTVVMSNNITLTMAHCTPMYYRLTSFVKFSSRQIKTPKPSVMSVKWYGLSCYYIFVSWLKRQSTISLLSSSFTLQTFHFITCPFIAGRGVCALNNIPTCPIYLVLLCSIILTLSPILKSVIISSPSSYALYQVTLLERS